MRKPLLAIYKVAFIPLDIEILLKTMYFGWLSGKCSILRGLLHR